MNLNLDQPGYYELSPQYVMHMQISSTLSFSINIVTEPSYGMHYGAFFVNPRVLQEGNRNHVNKCDRFAVPVVECDGPCYSLNVTSLHVKSREVLPFGTAYGCSQFVLGDEIDPHTACTKKDILLRTTPPYVVQAEYCLCSGDMMLALYS
nr:C. briggsae CBR-HOT-7 protein [Haemonchus contortus]